MTSRLVATALAGLAFLFAGCDNNSSTPTAPTGVLQVTTTRAILRAGETQPLTVTGPGGAPVTGGTWTSSDASVLTVSPAGIATATRAGRVTVTVTSGNASGSLALRVVPDYQGTWTGGLARPQITCSPASTATFCAPGAVTTGTVTLRVTQVGDQLTATLVDSAEPSVTLALTGQVLGDDQLSLAGRLDTPATAPIRRIEVANLRATLDVVLGTLTLRVTQAGDQLTATLVDSAEPSVTLALTGQVLGDDQLSLAGRLDTPATAPTRRIEVANLRATLDVVLGTLTGSYQWLVDRAPAGGALQADYAAQVQFRDLKK